MAAAEVDATQPSALHSNPLGSKTVDSSNLGKPSLDQSLLYAMAEGSPSLD
jgi:hypothetical protein